MNWMTMNTEHYIFHFHQNSLAEQEIHKIAAMQESCFECICDFLKVSMNKRIKYYLCNTPIEVGELYGDNEPANGFARMPDEIYAVYNNNIKCIGYHEDVHMISYNTISRPESSFIREGLAMYFDKAWWGISNYAWVQAFVRHGIYPVISGLLEGEGFFKYSDIITYPIAGVFTEYIINAHGIEKYKMFYEDAYKNSVDVFKYHYGVDIEMAEEKFLRFISNIKTGDVVLNMVENLLKKYELLK